MRETSKEIYHQGGLRLLWVSWLLAGWALGYWIRSAPIYRSLLKSYLGRGPMGPLVLLAVATACFLWQCRLALEPLKMQWNKEKWVFTAGKKVLHSCSPEQVILLRVSIRNSIRLLFFSGLWGFLAYNCFTETKSFEGQLQHVLGFLFPSAMLIGGWWRAVLRQRKVLVHDGSLFGLSLWVPLQDIRQPDFPLKGAESDLSTGGGESNRSDGLA